MLTSIKVNETELPLAQKIIKRGDNKGAQYYALDKERVTIALLSAAYGEKKLLENLILPKLQTMFQGYNTEATDDNGNFSEEEFQGFASQLSARGESIGDIQERIMECIDAADKTDDPTEIKSILMQMSALKEAMEKKRRKTAADKVAEAEGVPTA